MTALNLDNRTELNTIRKIVVVREYADGVCEVGFSNPPTPNQPEVDHRDPNDNQPDLLASKAKAKANLDRSLRRSKSNVRRKVMAADLDYMVTLTYRENKQDLDAAWIDFKKFIRKVQARNEVYPYVVVAERQQRGAVHFHMAVRGWQQIKVLRELWVSVVGDGNIHVDMPKHSVTSKWQLAKLAGYLAKYISKELTSAFGRQRYRVSEGIRLPMKRIIMEFPVGVDWIGEIFDSVGASCRFRYESGEGWAWACSW